MDFFFLIQDLKVEGMLFEGQRSRDSRVGRDVYAVCMPENVTVKPLSCTVQFDFRCVCVLPPLPTLFFLVGNNPVRETAMEIGKGCDISNHSKSGGMTVP